MYQFSEKQKKYLKKKYTFDFLVGFFGLLFSWPFLLIIAILIKLEDRGPVLFKQDRVGYHGKVFQIYKFRTMCVGAEKMEQGVYSDDQDPRITKIGNILRKTSLDELPQFINLVKGECSLIGPRAPLTYHPWPWEEYTKEQKQMFLVRPGITGWAQVNGRKTVEWHKRIELNVWYAQNVSFKLDAKIFFLTIYKIIKNEDNENVGKTV